MADLIPPDRNQCQVEITPAHSFMTFGPPPKPARCTNKAAVIATEKKPGKDGRCGAMSLCAECFKTFQEQMPADYATFEVIT